MAARRFLITSLVTFAVSAPILPQALRADDAGSQDVENAKHNFIGEINSSNVTTRSGPNDNGYVTGKLDKGQQVTVVGIKYQWLKIIPPDGSFAYVPKAYVNQRSDGKVGRVNHETFAKVGSTLNQMKTAPMCKVEENQDVQIIGDQDEYWKVKPPAGSFLYVNKNFVDPVKALPTAAEEKAQGASALAEGAHKAAPSTNIERTKPLPLGDNALPGSGPVVTLTPDPGATPLVPVPPTQPTEIVAAFDKLEAEFKAANEKQIDEQPVDTLLAGYEDLLKQDSLTGSTRKVAEVRVSTLKLRLEKKAEFAALKEAQLIAGARQRAMIAEREEIQQRIKQNEVVSYAAVGTMRTSSIQRGDGTLYRLTDPATGRTIAYLRTTDTKYATLMGQFVGIKGPITTDNALNMKIIESPTEAQIVDQNKVNTTVLAQIMPPSLLPGLRTARTAAD